MSSTDPTVGVETPNDDGSAVLAAPSTNLPPVLTVEEVARFLRVERKTVYETIARGELPGVRRFGRIIRISTSALLEWLANGQVRAGRSTRR